MNCAYYVVDAFTDAVFKGNPAGVCILSEPIQADTMQRIAAENNLAETAFVYPKGEFYDLRWFTPKVEIDLCGHATLASAFVIWHYIDAKKDTIIFETKSGQLIVKKVDGLFQMDFPTRKPRPIPVTALMEEAIGSSVIEAHASRDLLLLVEDADCLLNLKPCFESLRQLENGSHLGVIVTAKGNQVDFVSRFFAPGAGIPEDPVTGSSHTTLIPFWSERLSKKRMVARQLSERGGTLYCAYCGDRVKIAGEAVLYLSGTITFP